MWKIHDLYFKYINPPLISSLTVCSRSVVNLVTMKLATVPVIFFILLNFYDTVLCASSSAKIYFVNRFDSRIPINYRKDFQYRSLFGIILQPDQHVQFSVNASKVPYQVIIKCEALDSTKSITSKLLSKETSENKVEVKISEHCVPMLLVSKLDHEPPENDMYVRLNHNKHNPLPHYVLSEERMTKFARDSANETIVFLNSIQTFGFITTPRAQLMLAKSDARMLLAKPEGFLYRALVFLNDMQHVYHHYSGRSTFATNSSAFSNYNNVPDTIFYKYEKDRARNSAVCNSTGGTYIGNAVVYCGNTIEPFLIHDGSSWVLLHESAHHYDIDTTDQVNGIREVWANIYAVFYQSRYQLTDYWTNTREDIVEIYRSRKRFNDMDNKTRLHFLIALFSFGGDVSPFRAFNIEQMRNDRIADNLLKYITEFIARRYHYNVYPYVNNNAHSTWLTTYERFIYLRYPNILIPCFYYENISHPYPDIGTIQEHNLANITQLRLCPQRRENVKVVKFLIGFPGKCTLFVNGVKYVFTREGPKTFIYRTNDDLIVYTAYTNDSYIPYTVLNLLDKPQNYTEALHPSPMVKTSVDLNTINIVPVTKITILGFSDNRIGEIVINTENRSLDYTCFISDGNPHFPENYAEITVTSAGGIDKSSLIVKGKSMTVTPWSVPITEDSRIRIKSKEADRMLFFDNEKVTDVIGNQTLTEFQLTITNHGLLIEHDKENVKRYFVNKHRAYLENLNEKYALQQYEILNIIIEKLY